MSGRIIAFPPVAPPGATTLILGSMPSVESLRQGFYYAHPRNAFWRMLAEAYGERAPRDVAQRIALLERRGIALWDVLQSCEREGSLDSAIRRPVPNDFGALLQKCPEIRRVLLNGGTAARLFEKYGAALAEGRSWQRLPSTSPAYTLSYERKLALWRDALLRPESKHEHQSL